MIIKLDDMRDGEKSQKAFQRVLTLFEKYDINGAYGVIGDSLEDNGSKKIYYQFIKDLQASGRIEIWNHGYTHKLEADVKTTEFFNRSPDSQLKAMQKTNKLLLDKCGIIVKTFGAPYNSNDDNTLVALAKTEITVWLFPKPGTVTDILMLTSRVDIEPKTGVVSFEKFIADLSIKKSDTDYMILQGHPISWDEKSFEAFEKIIQFLLKNECIFSKPYVYSQKLLNSRN